MTEKLSKYKSIGEVAKLLDLNSNNIKTSTHTIRFWEKEFKGIKPKIFNGRRRYYDKETIDLLKKIKYLLKDKGMTIKGAKKALQFKNSSVDEYDNLSITSRKDLKLKVYNLSNLIKKIKY